MHRLPVDPVDPRQRAELDSLLRAGAFLSLEQEERWLRHGVVSTALERALKERSAEFDLVLALPYIAGTTYFAFKASPANFCLIPCLHDEPFARCAFVKRMLSKSFGLMFNSEPERQLAQRIAPTAARSAIVGVGIEPPGAVNPRGFREKYAVAGPFGVFVGRVEGEKNVNTLVAYFERYKERRNVDFSLVLAGHGTYQPPRRPDIRQVQIDWSDRDSMLSASTLLFQPSLKESLSIVLMQGWMAGRPAMVHARSEVLRYHCMQSNGGLWFPTYPEFEAELDRLLADPQLATALGAAGRDYVARTYSWSAVLDRFHAALQEWGVAIKQEIG